MLEENTDRIRKTGNIKGASCGPRIMLIIFVFLETLLVCCDLL